MNVIWVVSASVAVSMLILGWFRLFSFLPPFSHTSCVQPSRCQHSFVHCHWHIPQGSLHIWGDKESSFRRVRVAERNFFASAIQRETWALQRGVGDSTHQQCYERIGQLIISIKETIRPICRRLRSCNLALWRGRLESGNGEGSRDFLKGTLETVSWGVVYALSSFFIVNSTHIHWAARAANLNSLAQLTTIIIIIYSVLCYLRQNVPHKSLNWTWRQSKFKKRVHNRPSQRIQCRQRGTRNNRRTY